MSFKLSTLIIALLLSLTSYGQAVEGKLLGKWSDQSLPSSSNHNNRYNEIWGLEQDGREYAIIGTTYGTHFIDVTDSENLTEITRVKGGVTGPQVVHRDYHDYNGYLYAVCDEGAQSAMQIMDMSTLPDSVTVVYDSPQLIQRAHNIFIDEKHAILYGFISFGPLVLIDISTPDQPELIASYDNIEGVQLGWGSHDGFVDDNLAFLNIGDGLVIADFTDPKNAKLVTYVEKGDYPDSGYNHSGWMTEDRNYYYLADENHGFSMKVLDISELPDVKIGKTFDAESTSPHSIPHNQIVLGNHLYVAYYFDGLQVFDISDPENPVRIMHYPTSNEPHANGLYRGAWGVYPFLPSGNILVSDMQEGLFVVEGVDKLSSISSNPIVNEIAISPNPTSDYLNIDAGDLNLTKIELYTVDGKLMQSWTAQSSIRISDEVENGVYILMVATDQGTKSFNVVFQQ